MAESAYEPAFGMISMLRKTRNYGAGFTSDEDELIEREFNSNPETGDRKGEVSVRMDSRSTEKKKKKRIFIKPQNRHRSHDDDSDDDDIDSMIGEDEYKELFRMEYKTVFTDIVSSPEGRNIVKDFLDISEEEQNKRLGTNTQAPVKPLDFSSATTRFSQINAQIRANLKRQTHFTFVEQFEKEIIRYINEINKKPEPESLVVDFKDAYNRFVAHGVCEYYLLKSKSVFYEGKRVMVINKPKNLATVHVPIIHLSDYLKQTTPHKPEVLEQAAKIVLPPSQETTFTIIPNSEFQEKYKEADQWTTEPQLSSQKRKAKKTNKKKYYYK